MFKAAASTRVGDAAQFIKIEGFSRVLLNLVLPAFTPGYKVSSIEMEMQERLAVHGVDLLDAIRLHRCSFPGSNHNLPHLYNQTLTFRAILAAEVELMALAALNAGDNSPGRSVVMGCIVLVRRAYIDIQRVLTVITLVDEVGTFHGVIGRQREILEHENVLV